MGTLHLCDLGSLMIELRKVRFSSPETQCYVIRLHGACSMLDFHAGEDYLGCRGLYGCISLNV